MYYVQTFGKFSISKGDIKFPQKTFKSKKNILLLQYLISFHKKTISQVDLYENLWDENSTSNPLSALKTLIHRTRNSLEECGFSNSEQLITSKNGVYSWNPDEETVTDFDVFENLFKEITSKNADDETIITKGMEAVKIYRGQFLPGSANEYWVIPLSTYYNSLYVDIIKLLCKTYASRDDFNNIIELCTTAISTYAFEEEFYYQFINALYEIGNVKVALEQYNLTKDFYSTNFSVNLSPKFEPLYEKIISAENNLEFNLNLIEKSLEETETIHGAFYCEYEFFKRRFQLEVRSSKRNKTFLHICLFSILETDGNILPQNKLSKAMPPVICAIRDSLRASDIFSRFSATQFIVMLTDTNIKNATMVSDRIAQNCNKALNPMGLEIECDMKTYANSAVNN